MSSFDLDAWLASSPSPASIVQAGAAGLRRPALEVPPSLLGSPALGQLVDIMIETMRAAPGVGLAAPQIGVPLRVFVAEDTPEGMGRLSVETRAQRARTPLPLLVLVNPSVVAASADRVTFFEGCLSVRGYGALVPRAAAVVVAATDASGERLSLRMEGWPARIMQHEMDHLDGTLYVDRMVPRSLASDAELARLTSLPMAEVLREIGEAPACA
jgi:peptide deformylase